MKLFPFSEIWNPRRASDSSERIERTIDDRSRRLIAGVAVDSKFDSASGSLVVAKGRGKFCRVLFHDRVSIPLPGPLRESCLDLQASTDPSSGTLKACGLELADVQRQVVGELQRKAARYVDRILAVSVIDPGLWINDFDGKPLYLPISDPGRIAESTGLNVIDAFPSRDLEVGGQGGPLDLLPWWLLLADRSFPVSESVNGLIRVGNETSIILFAPSDGLDATVPDVIRFQTSGMNLIHALVQLSFRSPPGPEQIRRLLVSGIHSKSLLDAWLKITNGDLDSMHRAARAAIEQGVSSEQLFSTFSKWLFVTCEQNIKQGLQDLESQFQADQRRLESQRKSQPVTRFDYKPNFSHVPLVFLDAEAPIRDSLGAMLGNNGFKIRTDLGLASSASSNLPDSVEASSNHESLVAALLGLLHIDQIPANLPSLTGANQQRILGRISPGRPHQWRQLVREMADFQPPALKLRDAV